MKKIIIISIISFLILAPSISYAHPGRTGANGGHYCWTKCEKWGYEYGEYHFHAGKVKMVKTSSRKAARKEY